MRTMYVWLLMRAIMLEGAGVTVRGSVQGDWGTQFGMLIRYMFDRNEAQGLRGAIDEDVKDLQAGASPSSRPLPPPVCPRVHAPVSVRAPRVRVSWGHDDSAGHRAVKRC